MILTSPIYYSICLFLLCLCFHFEFFYIPYIFLRSWILNIDPKQKHYLLVSISIFDFEQTTKQSTGRMPFSVVGVPSELNCILSHVSKANQKKKKLFEMYSILNRLIFWYLMCMSREVFFRIFLFFYSICNLLTSFFILMNNFVRIQLKRSMGGSVRHE